METLRSYDELAAWAADGPPLYIAVGFYDGVHLGHRHLLAELRSAAQTSGAWAVALTFSNSPREYHGSASGEGGPTSWPYLTLPDEKLLLLGETGIDAALMLTYDASIAGQSAREFLRGLHRRAPLAGLCVGYDTSIGNDLVRGYQQFATLARELELELTYVEPYKLDGEPVKSSLVRERLAHGDVSRAAELLGHRYFISGPVVHGKGKGGTELGIPTANITVPTQKLAPPPGVYAGLVYIGAQPSAAAIGLSTAQQQQTTVLERGDLPAGSDATEHGSGETAVLEAAIHDFSGDLYGRHLRVEFLERLRGWRDFDSVAELAAQMHADIDAAVRLSAGIIEA